MPQVLLKSLVMTYCRKAKLDPHAVTNKNSCDSTKMRNITTQAYTIPV
jgi:hypothetical protein